MSDDCLTTSAFKALSHRATNRNLNLSLSLEQTNLSFAVDYQF